MPFRARAITAEADGQPIGIGGLAFLEDGTVAAFLEMPEASRKYAVTLHKAGLGVMQIARDMGIGTVVTLADPKVEQAKRWLLRLGFEPVVIDEQEVWRWQTR